MPPEEASEEQVETIEAGEPVAVAAPVDAPTPLPGEKKTIEVWAFSKGMLPQIFGGSTYALPGGAQVDRMGGAAVALGGLAGPRANPEFWRFAAAKAGSQWPENLEVTEAEFDAAVELATNGHQLR